MQFDARAAKALAPGQSMIVGGCPGLRLEATNTTKTWIYRYREPETKKLLQISLGYWPAMSLVQAAGKWDEARALRRSGESPAALKRAAAAEARAAKEAVKAESRARVYAVEDLCRDYMDGHIKPNRKPASHKLLSWQFDHLLPARGLGKMPVAAVDRRTAFEFLESWSHTPVQAKVIRQELAAAWDYALDAGRVDPNTINWWRLVKKGKLKSAGRKRAGHLLSKLVALRDAQAGEVIRFIERGNFTEAVGDALLLYLWTGCRGAEIVSMEVGEISEEADGLWWTCPKEKTKNCWRERATDQRVPLVGRAEMIVRRRLAAALKSGQPYLFPRVNGESKADDVPWMAQQVIGNAVWMRQPYCKVRPTVERERWHITHWTPHDLRRTARTMLAALGCDTAVAEAILGHMKAGIVGTYNRHDYDAERRVWLTRLAEHLESCVALPRPCSLAGDGPIPAG